MVGYLSNVLCLVVITASLGLCACGTPAPKNDLKESYILDMHCHTAGIGAGDSGCYVSPALRSNWRFTFYLKAFDISRRELENQGDAAIVKRLSEWIRASVYVDGAVVLALDGFVNDAGELDYEKTEIYIPNEFVATETAKYDNLFYGASIHPNRPDAIVRLDRAAANGAVLVKWLPSIQGIDPSDERLTPFYLRLKALGLPLLTHTGHEKSFTRANNDLADPRKLELPLKLGVTVIAAHAATTGKSHGQDNMERLLGLFDAYPNLYTDISSLTQLNKKKYLPRLLSRTHIRDRLLYGTDMPLINTPVVSAWYYPLKLNFRTILSIRNISNPWDRDVELKCALGVGDAVFTRPAELLLHTGRFGTAANPSK